MRRNFLFVMNGLADVDNFAPLMHQMLIDGHKVAAVFGEPYPWDRDFRILHFLKNNDFSIVPNWGPAFSYKVFRVLSRNIKFKELLQTHLQSQNMESVPRSEKTRCHLRRLGKGR